jgi:arabinose-5-phosphate isomerase
MIATAPIGPQTDPAERSLELAREVLRTEAAAVAALAARLDERFLAAVRLVLACRGRVVVTGVGKSGHVGRKIASTLASTGTPAFFVHPGEASHGDLGMITREDVVLALSYSGESDELRTILPIVKRLGAKLVALTGNTRSTLASLADVVLDARVEKEACPLDLAPTASTAAALALGDALAIAALDARGFGHEDFARSHPGGSLGRKLLTHVRDIMHTGEAVPRVDERASLADAVLEISRKRMGMTAVVDGAGRLAGLFTDGDLRRSLERGVDIRATSIAQVMTRGPRSIRPDALAAEAVDVMEANRITQLPVVDADGRLVGALNIHDLLRAKVL